MASSTPSRVIERLDRRADATGRRGRHRHGVGQQLDAVLRDGAVEREAAEQVGGDERLVGLVHHPAQHDGGGVEEPVADRDRGVLHDRRLQHLRRRLTVGLDDLSFERFAELGVEFHARRR